VIQVYKILIACMLAGIKPKEAVRRSITQWVKMGERQKQPFQLSFNISLKANFQGSRVTSDAGLILVRESDERLGFSALIEGHLADSRGKTVNCRWRTCCGNPGTAVWRVTKT